MAKKTNQPRNKDDRLWAEAKRRCRLSADDVRMAKEMGLNPRSLIKNIPSRTEQWKQPVKYWIRQLYQKRQEKSAKKKARKEQAAVASPVADAEQLLKDGIASLEDESSFCEGDDFIPDQQEIQDENRAMLHRHEQFHIAAEYIADRLSNIPEVQKIVLFGSVAGPLDKEIPRFPRLRRLGVPIWHECRDIDLAVWVSNLNRLRALQEARSQALNNLLAEKHIGVAHHQVDIFVMKPATDCYLGRLCIFSACPKGKNECRVPGCGEPRFLQRHEDSEFDLRNLSETTNIVLFDRCEDSQD